MNQIIDNRVHYNEDSHFIQNKVFDLRFVYGINIVVEGIGPAYETIRKPLKAEL